jgi:DNA-binding transcriptional MerR regulator
MSKKMPEPAAAPVGDVSIGDVPVRDVPIREVSRLTGVKSMTLRAWERRYGLLNPKRTRTGHRLYSPDDIQRVRDIQSWLLRGLAVGQVRDVLAAGVAEDNPIAEPSSEADVWRELLCRLHELLARLDHAGLASLLRELNGLYPLPLIADNLLAPMLDTLHLQREYGATTRLALLDRTVLEHLYFGQNRQRQSASGARLLIVKSSAEESDILPLALSYSLLEKNFRAQFLGHIPAAEVVFAAEKMHAQGLVVYGDSAAQVPQLQKQLEAWRGLLQIPFFLGGRVISVYRAQAEPLADTELAQSLTDLCKSIAERLTNK